MRISPLTYCWVSLMNALSEDEVVIEFKQGVPVKIDGRDVTPLQAIEEMNRRAGAQGIGRVDLIEDRTMRISPLTYCWVSLMNALSDLTAGENHCAS